MFEKPSTAGNRNRDGNSKVQELKKKIEEWNEEWERELEEWEGWEKVEKGDSLNLPSLLFTKTRDYLIKYNDNHKVKAEELAGKVVVLYFVSTLSNIDNWRKVTAEMVHLYNVMQPKGGFEVVFVAARDFGSCGQEESIGSTLQERFEERFSIMPWTAIPFSDRKSRKLLEKLFDICNDVDYCPRSIVIDPTGVVQCENLDLLSVYGAEAYPFTDERREFLKSQDIEALMNLSKKALLASPERDFLITNKGDQVPVHNLEDKVVGLLFFDEMLKNSLDILVEIIRKAYEELANKENFEVVLIYVTGTWHSENPTDEESFWNVFRTMPWLALPFKDANCKKLMRIFGYPIHVFDWSYSSPFVIVGPHGKFVELMASKILRIYGTPAYPFTLSSAVHLIAENAKKAKLERFWEPDAIFRQKNGFQVRFSQLFGKRIIVLFNALGGTEFISKLSTKYIQMKSTDGEFEVIHIWEREDLDSVVAASVPWLMYPPFDRGSDADKLLHNIFGYDGYIAYHRLIAYDVDGSVVRFTEWPNVQDDTVFPFYDGDLEGEIFQVMQRKHQWPDRIGAINRRMMMK